MNLQPHIGSNVMNPSNKRILKIYLIGILAAVFIGLLCDGINYLTWSDAWTRQQDAGFPVSPGNVWWTWLN